MTITATKKLVQKLTWKKHSGRGNFVLIFKPFSRFREYHFVFKLKLTSQDPCHWVDEVHMYNSVRFIFTLFSFSYTCVQIEHEILSQQFSVTDRFPQSLDTEPKISYWWNLKSLFLYIHINSRHNGQACWRRLVYLIARVRHSGLWDKKCNR